MAETMTFDTEEKGQRIENLPAPNIGAQTGWYFTDYYGTWYEVKRDCDNVKFWMIGKPKR